jgi:uncharacterized protein involved in outer membrane biogenesis
VSAPDGPLAEAARLASAFGVAFGADTRVQGRLDADVRAHGPASRPAFDGRLRMRNVTISGPDIPRPVRTDSVDLSLSPAEIRSNDFSASTNGTSLGARFTLRQYTTSKPALDASIRTEGANLGDVLTVARAWAVDPARGSTGTGRLTMNLRAVGAFDALTLSGSGTLDEATVTTPAIGQPIQVHHAGLAFTSNAVTAENLRLTIGKTSAEGHITVRNFAAPTVAFQLVTDRIDVAELQRTFEPAPEPSPQPLPRQRQARETLLQRMTGSGRLRAGSLTYGQLTLDNVDTTATFDNGRIRLDPFTSRVFGGRHRGSIAVDARRAPATLVVASDLEQVDANRLASAVVNLRDVIYGALGSVVRVSFSAGGAEDIARSLNGTLTLDVPDGRVANMDLMYEIAQIAQFAAGRRAALTSTPVAALTARFKVTDGRATTDDLVALIDGGSIGASGSIDLATQAMSLRMIAVLSGDFSRRVGGTAAGGFMATVLANRRGELVVPMLATGTVRHPRFAPDVQRIAEMKLRNLVPTLSDPQRLILEILGAIGEEQQDGRPPGTPAHQPTGREIEEALRKLLGAGKPPKEKPP